MKVYITDLEAYNNGHLVGAWYQLPMNEDLLAESIENVLQEGKSICEDEHFHEEYFITDYECNYMEIEEYSNLTKLNEIAEAMESIDEDAVKVINFLIENQFVKDIFEAIESYEESLEAGLFMDIDSQNIKTLKSFLQDTADIEEEVA